MQDEQPNTAQTDTAPCGAALCHDAADFVRGALLLQEKWVMLIIFRLLSGPTGFCDLMRQGHINTTTLTQRLLLLEQAGLLVRTVYSVLPPRTSYALTDAGRALQPILGSIGKWSGTYLAPLKEPHACLGQGCPETTEAGTE